MLLSKNGLNPVFRCNGYINRASDIILFTLNQPLLEETVLCASLDPNENNGSYPLSSSPPVRTSCAVFID